MVEVPACRGIQNLTKIYFHATLSPQAQSPKKSVAKEPREKWPGRCPKSNGLRQLKGVKASGHKAWDSYTNTAATACRACNAKDDDEHDDQDHDFEDEGDKG